MAYRDPAAKRAYDAAYCAAHRAEKRAYDAAHYAAHRAEKHAYGIVYRNTDAGYAVNRAAGSRRTARRRDAVIDPELTNAILTGILREHDNCAWCRNSLSLRERVIDHRIAIVFGGMHTLSNVQILCEPCHKTKSSAEKSLLSKLRNGNVTQSDFALAV